eukprot:1155993-Pelagomonas_calceolata.AAC.5
MPGMSFKWNVKTSLLMLCSGAARPQPWPRFQPCASVKKCQASSRSRKIRGRYSVHTWNWPTLVLSFHRCSSSQAGFEGERKEGRRSIQLLLRCSVFYANCVHWTRERPRTRGVRNVMSVHHCSASIAMLTSTPSSYRQTSLLRQGCNPLSGTAQSTILIALTGHTYALAQETSHGGQKRAPVPGSTCAFFQIPTWEFFRRQLFWARRPMGKHKSGPITCAHLPSSLISA